MAAECRIDRVDGRPCCDQPVDDLEALMVGGHRERSHAGVLRRVRAEPARHVAGGRRLLEVPGTSRQAFRDVSKRSIAV
jgi:hypothetical protein